MKKLTLTLALVIASIGAAQAATDKVFESSKGQTLTVFDSGITKAGKNARGDIEIYFTLEHAKGTERHREQTAITCGSNGGYMGFMDGDGEVPNQTPWVPDGPTLRDKIGTYVCIRAIEKATGNQYLTPQKKQTKNSI